MSILEYVGNTPLLKLASREEDLADIYVKLEMFNPGGSIKTRVALRMIKDAEKAGALTKGDSVIEATGGNTGIGLAIASNVKGYHFIAVVPDNYSQRRIRTLQVYGAEVITSDSRLGNDSHIKLVERMIQENRSYKWLNQFVNPASVRAHYEGTAKEIAGEIMPDAFVAAVGSAGTLQGIGSYFKNINPDILVYAAQPEGCDLACGKACRHHIQGVSLGIKPPILDYRLIDDYIEVNDRDVKDVLHQMICKEGLFLGLSSGLNIAAAKRVARRLGQGHCVCTVAPDGGDSYLDDALYK